MTVLPELATGSLSYNGFVFPPAAHLADFERLHGYREELLRKGSDLSVLEEAFASRLHRTIDPHE